MKRDQNTGRFRRTESHAWPQPQAREECSVPSSVASAFGILAGAGLGAAAMFLLDPDKGPRRREHLAHAAESALETTTDAVSSAWENVSERAVDTGSALVASLPSRKQLRKHGRGLMNTAGSAASSTRETAGDWLESAASYLPGRRTKRHYLPQGPDVSASTAGLSALGALALGMGAMWLFDPARGRARRAWIGQKTNRVLSETGDFMRATGRHVRNRSKGYYHETRKLASGVQGGDFGIAETVRSALGRLGIGGSSSSVGVSCKGGCVTLTGRCVNDDVDRVLATTRGVPGVTNVISELKVGDPFPTSSTSGAPTPI